MRQQSNAVPVFLALVFAAVLLILAVRYDGMPRTYAVWDSELRNSLSPNILIQ